jgi:lipopolysaccharide export system permease protein
VLLIRFLRTKLHQSVTLSKKQTEGYFLIVDRYIAKEVLQTLTGVMVVLLLVFMGRFFALYLAEASAGEITSDIVIDMLLLKTITSLSLLLPFGFYVAILLAFGRLYKDSEMTALAAGGIGLGRVMRTVFMMAIPCSLVVAMLSLWTVPWAHETSLKIKEEARAGTPFAMVSPGQFADISEGQQVFYVEALSEDRSQLRKVFVQDRSGERLVLYAAASGYQYRDKTTGDQFLVLVDGYRYEGKPGEKNFTIYQYEKNAVRLEEQEVVTLRRKRWALASSDLWGSTDTKERAELQWRLSLPVVTLVLAALGVLLSRTSPRQGRFAKLFVAILVFIIYYNLLGLAQAWLEKGVIPVFLGLWWVHGAMILLGTGFVLRQYGSRWLWDSLRGSKPPEQGHA